MNPRSFIPVLLLLLILAGPAAALTITAEGVSSYSTVAVDGMVIYQITINELPIGTNQTHTLSYNGDSFLLSIGTYQESIGGIWKNADITLTFPNGTVQTAHPSTMGVATNYKTTIQYVNPQSYSASLPIVTVDLDVGFNPLTASFDGGAIWYPENALPFTAASGELGGTTTVYIEEMSVDDFQNNVVNYNPVYGISNLGSQVFQWSWNAIMGFINMIPVIGPVMVNLINTMGGIISVGYYWLNFVVSNFPAILCGVEALILMMAVINAGKGKNSFSRLARNFYCYNLAFMLGPIGLANTVWNWTRTGIELVAKVVEALKPT